MVQIDGSRAVLCGVFLILVLLWPGVALVSVCSGSTPLTAGDVWTLLLDADSTTAGVIVWKLRLPRAIATLVGGGLLSVSGLLLQVYFRNPIVGPFVLGISSGATLMVSVVMLTSVTVRLQLIGPFTTTVAAVIGAGLVMALVVAVAARLRSGVTVLIVGLMVGYLCHSATAVLTAFAEKEQIKGFVLWGLGSFSGFRWEEINILLFLGGALLLLVLLLAKPLNALLLGEEYALSMGICVRRLRVLLLLASCTLAGMVTAMAGPVAFVGLAVPHMARMLFSTSDNRILIPASLLLGGLVTSLCDLAARSLIPPVELPLSAVTALFGAPVVIALLLKRQVKL